MLFEINNNIHVDYLKPKSRKCLIKLRKRELETRIVIRAKESGFEAQVGATLHRIDTVQQWTSAGREPSTAVMVKSSFKSFRSVL